MRQALLFAVLFSSAACVTTSELSQSQAEPPPRRLLEPPEKRALTFQTIPIAPLRFVPDGVPATVELTIELERDGRLVFRSSAVAAAPDVVVARFDGHRIVLGPGPSGVTLSVAADGTIAAPGPGFYFDGDTLKNDALAIRIDVSANGVVDAVVGGKPRKIGHFVGDVARARRAAAIISMLMLSSAEGTTLPAHASSALGSATGPANRKIPR